MASKINLGPAYDRSTGIGPVINQGLKEYVLNWIETGIKVDAELVLDGRNPKMPAECKGGFFAGPTIFDYVKVEIEDRPRGDFQPRSLHQRVENFEEGLEIMNENRFANDSVIYTENRACARE